MNENHTDNNTPLQSDRRPLRVGDIVEGKVTKLQSNFVSVIVDNVKCTLPVKEITWGNGRYHLPKIDDVIQAAVVMIKDGDVILSMKRLRPDPWKNIDQQKVVGEKVLGTVIQIQPEGAVIEINEDLIGIVRMDDTQTPSENSFPQQLLGKFAPVSINEVFVDRRWLRFTSGYDWSSDPWERAKKSFPVNSCHDAFITAINEDSITATLQAGVEAIIMETDPNTTADSYYRLNIRDKVKIIIVDWDISNQRLIAQIEDSSAN
ncbi:hypothetical protein [uncultured Porphyromonas sp.]|uniref:hypothetical protein n=1 Tax=uncultured Porphyromonas sp. TaxID=159274 RepID=UPI002633AC4C|nr:hypothetical protein [uncultured Porphyromonas sp.]